MKQTSLFNFLNNGRQSKPPSFSSFKSNKRTLEDFEEEEILLTKKPKLEDIEEVKIQNLIIFLPNFKSPYFLKPKV